MGDGRILLLEAGVSESEEGALPVTGTSCRYLLIAIAVAIVVAS
jgi:hypothetical protein